jgi:hypothetical protein
MDLILWRHAEAEPGEPDMGRRLTAKGIQQAERMAKWLDHHLPATTRILSSPADRAQQTAQALKRKFRVVGELAPGASVSAVLDAAGWPDDARRSGGASAYGTAYVVERAQGRCVVALAPRTRRYGVDSAEGRHRARLRLIV